MIWNRATFKDTFWMQMFSWTIGRAKRQDLKSNTDRIMPLLWCPLTPVNSEDKQDNYILPRPILGMNSVQLPDITPLSLIKNMMLFFFKIVNVDKGFLKSCFNGVLLL